MGIHGMVMPVHEIEDLKELTTQAYRSMRKIKNRLVDIVVGTESRFEDGKNIPLIEHEVLKRSTVI